MLLFLAKPPLDDDTILAYLSEGREICREIGIEIWEASCLRQIADITEQRGDPEWARALRAEATALYPEEPIDPEMLDAFEQALTAEDRDAAFDAAREMFGR
jgi:hypothetical protein